MLLFTTDRARSELGVMLAESIGSSVAILLALAVRGAIILRKGVQYLWQRNERAHDFDDIDQRILRELQDDGRVANVTLADRVGLSPAPCLRRLRSLERAGIIRKYVTLIDGKTVGLGVTVFVQIRS